MTLDQDISRRLGAVEQAIATLTERQAGFALQMSDQVRRMEKKQDDILDHVEETNGSVAHLELWQARVIGAVGVILFLMASFGATLLAYLLATG